MMGSGNDLFGPNNLSLGRYCLLFLDLHFEYKLY